MKTPKYIFRNEFFSTFVGAFKQQTVVIDSLAHSRKEYLRFSISLPEFQAAHLKTHAMVVIERD
ncbi:hypothetical protein G9P44_001639 [Scheffersomyces stipitis]|nr:hypothetical protein G9P44_001639 [Scheffersomyces stipitis]